MKPIAALVVVVAVFVTGSIAGCCTCECGSSGLGSSSDVPDFPDAAQRDVTQRAELAPSFAAAAAAAR